MASLDMNIWVGQTLLKQPYGTEHPHIFSLCGECLVQLKPTRTMVHTSCIVLEDLCHCSCSNLPAKQIFYQLEQRSDGNVSSALCKYAFLLFLDLFPINAIVSIAMPLLLLLYFYSWCNNTSSVQNAFQRKKVHICARIDMFILLFLLYCYSSFWDSLDYIKDRRTSPCWQLSPKSHFVKWRLLKCSMLWPDMPSLPRLGGARIRARCTVFMSPRFLRGESLSRECKTSFHPPTNH